MHAEPKERAPVAIAMRAMWELAAWRRKGKWCFLLWWEVFIDWHSSLWTHTGQHARKHKYAKAHKRYYTHLFTPQGEAELECIFQSQWPGRGVLGPKLGARENRIRHAGSPKPSPPHKHDYWPFTATYRLPLLSQQIILALSPDSSTMNKELMETSIYLSLCLFFFIACIPNWLGAVLLII